MNKLKKKIFWTLFIILTFFLVSILFIFTYQNYSREKTIIEQNLLRMTDDLFKGFDNPKINGDFKWDELKEDPRRFIDAKIYTILLDKNDDVFKIISHTEDGLVDDGVEEVVSKIVAKNENGVVHIGNLYFSGYSYKYVPGSYMTLIEHIDVRDRLVSSLEITILLLVCAEVVIVIISKMLSDWIIKPVEISFNKQKQFVADASHELKTPLSIIIACAETLEDDPNERKWLDNIKSESERMNKLIASLLDLAKVESENGKSLYEEIDLTKSVEKSVLSFESLAFEKDIKLDYEIEQNVRFKCDSDEIHELLSILLDNAVAHSFKKASITVKLRSEKGNIVLEVTNEGEPIPKGEEEKIFERFYRLDKARNRNENRYGLGLAIAKSIVTKHDGRISAFSLDGRTTFRIIFKK